ncbi:unnamed protein product [Effrenium voratum]|nr:unnamed protein product [Effrenium voratum]CAJ1454826.1 unnamed protein product [Effrenium voratum]
MAFGLAALRLVSCVVSQLPGCRRPSSCRFLNRHGIGQTCRWLSLHLQDWHNLRQPLDPNGRCNWAIDTPCTAMQARAPTQSQGSATSRCAHCFAKVRGPIARWPGLHFGGFGLGSLLEAQGLVVDQSG